MTASATANPASYAGIFVGNLAATGAKSAAVPFPDGSRRLLYCMESPELWFEDFGTAKLRRGRAVVQFDANFAKVIEGRDYKVFLTREGNCRGLYLRRKRATSFEVRELMGGTASITFSYRIVGRRKDIKGHRRFAKFEMRLPVPPAVEPVRRKRKALRTFVASLEREVRAPAGSTVKKAQGPTLKHLMRQAVVAAEARAHRRG